METIELCANNWALAHLKMLFTNIYVFKKIYIYVCVWFDIKYPTRVVMHKTQPTNQKVRKKFCTLGEGPHSLKTYDIWNISYHKISEKLHL